MANLAFCKDEGLERVEVPRLLIKADFYSKLRLAMFIFLMCEVHDKDGGCRIGVCDHHALEGT